MLSDLITGTDTGTSESSGLPSLPNITDEVRDEQDRVPHSMEDGPVFSSETLIEDTVDDGVEAAVEVGYAVGSANWLSGFCPAGSRAASTLIQIFV